MLVKWGNCVEIEAESRNFDNPFADCGGYMFLIAFNEEVNE